MRKLIVTAIFALLLLAVSAEEHHKRCCSTCKANYPQAHHLKHSCLHGCRLYSMTYLAHDKSIPSTELANMCSKSCQTGFTGAANPPDFASACNVGCREQERVFKEHGMSEQGAKMSVIHGVGMPPIMHSAVPFHQRIFQHMRVMHNRMIEAMKNAKHAVIQHIQIRIHSLSPGPDGKPRYQVEIHQRRIPMAFGRPFFGAFPDDATKADKPSSAPLPPSPPPMGRHPLLGGDDHDMMPHHGPPGHHGELDGHHRGPHGHEHHHDRHHRHGPMYRVRHFFSDMSEPVKTGLRWSLLAVLIISVVCLGWLCCRACRRIANGQRQHQPLSLTKAFTKKKPCVQSGDIFYVDVSDKKPLIEDDGLDAGSKEDTKKESV